MWIVSRVIFYRHWSFYRAYLLWNNKRTTHIEHTKKKQCERKNQKIEQKRVAFVWHGLLFFFSFFSDFVCSTDDNNWLVLFSIYTRFRDPRVQMESNLYHFRSIYTNILMSWTYALFWILYFQSRNIRFFHCFTIQAINIYGWFMDKNRCLKHIISIFEHQINLKIVKCQIRTRFQIKIKHHQK